MLLLRAASSPHLSRVRERFSKERGGYVHKDALAHYQAVLDNQGASKTTVERAKKFLEQAHRGFAKDG